MNNLKELFTAIKDSPSGVIMTMLMAGACYVYSDFKDFLEYEREQMTIERTEQRTINAQFVDSLNKINTRLELIEKQISK